MITIRYAQFGRTVEDRYCASGEELAGVIAELMELAEQHVAIERLEVEWDGGRDALGVADHVASVAPSDNLTPEERETAKMIALYAGTENTIYREFMDLAKSGAPIYQWAIRLYAYVFRCPSGAQAMAMLVSPERREAMMMAAAHDLRDYFLADIACEARFQSSRR